VDGVGTGADVFLQCRLPPRHPRRQVPWALGRPASEVWAEIWVDIRPRIERVLSAGESTWDEALMLLLERSGYSDETFHTFSYSPLRDEDANVVGMLCVVSEDTERIISERRMTTLRDLGSDPSVVRTERQILDFAADQLAGNPYDLPFTLTYLFDDDGDARLAGVSGITPGHRAAPETLSGSGPSISLRATAVGDGLQVTVTDTGAWKTPRDSAGSHRGRGISLMRHLMEDSNIQSSGAGTTVHMYARIT